MNETSHILATTTARMFAQHFTDDVIRESRSGAINMELWAVFEEAGLPLALVDEEMGGFGIDPADALDLVQANGSYASPLPLAETMMANAFLARAGIPPREGILTLATIDHGAVEESSISGTAYNVPWAGQAREIVLVADGLVAVVPTNAVAMTAVPSISGLPRMTVTFDSAPVESARADWALGDHLMDMGALLRSLEMAGALVEIARMSTDYANERVQFGRPIGKQQAIQQQLAVLATQAAASCAASRMASAAYGSSAASHAIAIAKTRIGEAVGIGAGIAHQVHGAIGFTNEHRLQLLTRSLWSWRDEFGSEQIWSERIGRQVMSGGDEGFWPSITAFGVT
ncbi:MAG: acyl-CoA dehydrogenase family protein [Novosphingobium sp.]